MRLESSHPCINRTGNPRYRLWGADGSIQCAYWRAYSSYASAPAYSPLTRPPTCTPAARIVETGSPEAVQLAHAVMINKPGRNRDLIVTTRLHAEMRSSKSASRYPFCTAPPRPSCRTRLRLPTGRCRAVIGSCALTDPGPRSKWCNCVDSPAIANRSLQWCPSPRRL